MEQKLKTEALNYLIENGKDRKIAREIVEELPTIITNLRGDLKKFYPGIMRWIIEGQINWNSEESKRKLNKLFQNLEGTPVVDFYDEDFNGNSIDQVVEILGFDLSAKDYNTPEDVTYDVFELTNHNEIKQYEYYGNWCILDEIIWNSYTQDGRRYFMAERSDYKQVPKSKGNNYPHDDYGMSLIIIGYLNGKVCSVTSRWNIDDTGDHFLTVEELKDLLGEEFEWIK